MMRIMLSTAIAALVLTLGLAIAVEPDEILSDPALEARARALSQELRCVVCQNQSIDDSNAPLARDMRLLVRERIKLGDSDEQVRAFLVARYGNFVLLKPPLQSDTFILWFSPLAFLAAAFALVWMYFRSMGKRGAAALPLSAEEEAALKRLADEG
jgi:cytochrome c-type biogenesis protein CcmH